MNKQFLKDSLGWGFILWLIGYILGILLFIAVPQNIIGWVITPIGAVITSWVLYKKINSTSLTYYLWIAIIWVIIAIVFDYIFIVKAFKSEQYYQLDIYLYYTLTLTLPLLIGWYKKKANHDGPTIDSN